MPPSFTVWLNGDFLAADEARLPIDDAAITSGVTVTERLRTFQHKPFLLEPHLDRLFASAESAFIESPLAKPEIERITSEVVRRNAELVDDDDDLTISIWLSAGRAGKPTLCVGAAPIPAARYAEGYTTGISLVVPPTRAIAAESLSPVIKTRSRLHWHIADCQAETIEPGAWALLLDAEGFVTETAVANIFAVIDNRLLTPNRGRTLSGISQQYVFNLAKRLGLDIAEANLTIDNVLAAEEVFCTSSIFCIQPVRVINQQPIGTGRPGPIYRQLINAWSQAVGVDIPGQMSRVGFAHRS